MPNQVTYGFLNLQNVFDQRVTQVGVDTVLAAVDQSLAEHDRQVRSLLALFADETTDSKTRFVQAGVRKLQPADEFSRALPTQPGGYIDIAFPLDRGQDALGLTYEASQRVTVGDINRWVNDAMAADARWLRDHLLATLLRNTSRTFVDEQLGSLTVKPLANGDSDTYYVVAGADSGATDTHYLAQTAAIADATNPYDDIAAELLEHPENGGEVVALIGQGLTASTRGLANFVPLADPNVAQGANSDRLVGTLGVAVPGRLIGYVDEVWIVEWRQVPANTILAVATEGARPLAMREFPEPSLRGFRRDAERNNYPWYEQHWTRRAGFGGQNRVGAVAYQVSNGDTTFDIPAIYSAFAW